MKEDRGSKAWKANKERKNKRVRPELSGTQLIEFCNLVAQMASLATFERILNLNSADIQYYQDLLDIKSPDDARKLARVAERDKKIYQEILALQKTLEAREAEMVAQARLESFNAEKAIRLENSIKEKPNIDDIKQEDAERQRRFANQNHEVKIPQKKWQLKFENGAGSQQEQIDRFRREIVYRGLNFTSKKHNATHEQIRYEAARLGLKINWDLVRK